MGDRESARCLTHSPQSGARRLAVRGSAVGIISSPPSLTSADAHRMQGARMSVERLCLRRGERA